MTAQGPADRSPAAPRRSGDQVAALTAELRAQIISGALRPGEPLRQELLADRFATSRMPIREALRVLESEGLVVLVPHKGAAVAPLDPAELEEVYEMRVAAETLALRRAIPELSNSQIDRAERIQDRAEAAGMAGFDVADRYLTFTAGALDYRDRSHREHRALLAACRRRDEATAVDLLGRHIAEAGETLLRHLRKSPRSGRGD